MTDTLGLPNIAPIPGVTPTDETGKTDAQIEQADALQYLANPQLQQDIANEYGFVGSFLLSVPELKPILVAAAIQGWDQSRFDGAVTQTNWWQTSSSALRNFQQQSATDPASTAAAVSATKEAITNISQSLGIPLSGSTLDAMATWATGYNFDQDQLQQLVRSQSASAQTPTPQFGATATFATQARQLAGQYGINLPDATLAQYVAQSAAGTLTADGLQNLFMKQAQQMYPWMSEGLQSGVTVSQYLSGYASAAGTTLGVDPNSIIWSDPKWQTALTTSPAKAIAGNGTTGGGGTAPPQNIGQPVSIGQFQQNLMKDPSFGYKYTTGARDNAYSVANQILQTFGKVKS